MKDARSLSPEVGETLRERAVVMFKGGWKHADIAGALGVSAATVRDWSSHYRRHGKADFVRDARAANKGRAPNLSASQERLLAKRLTESDPEQMKLPFPLWTRAAVVMLAERLCGVKLSKRTTGNYLNKWGFTPQKPVKRAYEQNPEAVRVWLDEKYPVIDAKAKTEDAVILWADETHVSNQANVTRGYAPKGETPEIRATAKRASFSVISAVSNKGDMRWMVFAGGLDGALAVRFLERLVRSVGARKVILIWDNLRVHHGKEVKKWLKGKEKEIEVFHLPSYSPQLNPDERLNRDLKGTLSRRPVARSHKQIRKGMAAALASIQRQPERIKGYFKSQETAYAA